MSLNYVFFIAIYYVIVQCALLYNLRGGWRIAAFLPIPLVSVTMCVSVVSGLVGPIVSALLMMFALPIGTAYLLIVAIAWLVLDKMSAWQLHRRTSAP